MKAGIEKNIGHEQVHDIEARYSETTRETVSTGWDIINELTQGGLGGGEASLFNQHPERPTHNSLKPYGTT